MAACKGFQAEAGWFALLGLAARVTGADLDAGVAQILTDRGWRADGNSPVSATQAHRSTRPSLDPPVLTRLARGTLLGVAKPA